VLSWIEVAVAVLTLATSVGGSLLASKSRERVRMAVLLAEFKGLKSRVDTVEADCVVTQALAVAVAEAARDLKHFGDQLARIERDVHAIRERQYPTRG
jgi:hypothetical protein